jgi:sugar (pentulose or hexulose) kinase
MGAAMTGALAIGDPIVPLPDGEDSSEEVLPNPEYAATYRKQRKVYKQIHPQLAGVFENLS